MTFRVAAGSDEPAPPLALPDPPAAPDAVADADARAAESGSWSPLSGTRHTSLPAPPGEHRLAAAFADSMQQAWDMGAHIQPGPLDSSALKEIGW
jgi:hypothetical protein